MRLVNAKLFLFWLSLNFSKNEKKRIALNTYLKDFNWEFKVNSFYCEFYQTLLCTPVMTFGIGAQFSQKRFSGFSGGIKGTLARNGFPAGNYMFKVTNRNTRTRWEICSKLTIKIPERRYWRRSGIFIVNSEQISHLVLVFLLLTLSR